MPFTTIHDMPFITIYSILCLLHFYLLSQGELHSQELLCLIVFKHLASRINDPTL